MRERWAELALLVRTAVRTDPWRSLGSLLEPLGSLMFPLFGWFLGLAVDGLLTHDGTRLTTAVVGLLVTIALRYVAAYVGTAIRTGLAERVGFAFDEEIARLAGGLPGLAHQEHAGYRDRLELLRQSQGALGQSLNHVVATANALVGALGTAVVLVLVHPLVLLLVVFALPALPLAALQQRGHARAEETSAAPARLARHLRGLALDPRAAPELRVFGLGQEVLDRLDRAWTTARRPLHRAQVVAFGISAVRSVVFAVGFGLAVGFVLWRAARGQAGAGDVVTAVVVCQQVQNQVLGPAYGLAGMGRVLRAAGRLRWLRAHAAAVTAGLGDRPAPESLGEGIELSEVSFRYRRRRHVGAAGRVGADPARHGGRGRRRERRREVDVGQTAHQAVRTHAGQGAGGRHRSGRGVTGRLAATGVRCVPGLRPAGVPRGVRRRAGRPAPSRR